MLVLALVIILILGKESEPLPVLRAHLLFMTGAPSSLFSADKGRQLGRQLSSKLGLIREGDALAVLAPLE